MSDVIRLASENYVNQEVAKASFTAVIGQTTYEELLDAINKGYSVFAHAGGVASGVTLPMTMQIPVSKTTTRYPVYMEGYKYVTISDFVDTDGNQMTDKIYQGDGHYLNHLNNIDDLGGIMVSMKVKFAEGSHTNRIDIGGNAEYTGFSINPNTEGTELYIIDNYNIAGGDSNVIAQISKDDVNVNSFVGDEFLLQIGFSYSHLPYSGSKLYMRVYINGILCNNGQHFNIEEPTNKGTYMNLYLENSTSAITLSSVNVEDWFDIIQFTSVLKFEKEYYVLEASCNHLPDGSTVWSTQDPIKIPQDYITHKALNQALEEKSTAYEWETILPNSNFYLREKGLYIVCGYDYNLNFYNSNGELQGEDNCLSIIIFCTEADANGNFSVFAMQNYKGTLGVSSIKSLVLSGFNSNAYIKNTNTNEGSTVFYMRQREV
jgi:hypothetical protein